MMMMNALMKRDKSTSTTPGEEPSQNDGFSLIELIVVVLIIGIIAAIAIPIFLNTQDNARQAAVEATAASALSSVQEQVLNGSTSFDTLLSSMSTDEVSLSMIDEHFVAGDPDTVCIQAGWIGAENVAVSGANCGGNGGSTPGEDDEEEQSWDGNMVLEWEIEAGRTISLPASGNVSGTIDWGDGTVEPLSEDNQTHTYEEADTYFIELHDDATFDTWSSTSSTEINNSLEPGDLSGLTRVLQWGETETTSLAMGFNYAQDLVEVAEPPNTVTHMGLLFYRAHSFNGDISHWDVSNVTNMRYIFGGATRFNQPLNDWDVSNIDNTSGMFSGASRFNQPIGNWDVSNVTNMHDMFWAANDFNQDISSWDVSNVTNMHGLLRHARSFNQPLEEWGTRTGNVTRMELMFSSASSFNQDLSGWDVSSVSSYEDFSTDSNLDPENLPDFN